MQPTQLALVIHKGATFRARLRVMQPTPEYRDITEIIAAAPVRLTVDHGLPTDWPIWIERVLQFPALNRALPQQQPHFARVVDAATLEISTINATGTNGAGGQIAYYPPLPLAGAAATLTLYEKGEAVGTLPVTVDAGGWVDVVLTDEQTGALDWSALEYTLDVQLGSTDVLRVYAGKATAIAAGTTPATCQGFAVIGADRGPPGPTVANAEFDDEGRLVITLEDGTVLTSNALNRPWGTIAGDIASQMDLMELFGEKVDGDDYLAFVQSVTNALNDRYTKGESDQALADAIATRTTPAEAAAAAPVQSVQGRTGNVSVTKSDLALDNVDNTSDANKPLSDAATTALALKLNTALKGADNGLAELDNDGKVPLSQISDAVLGQLNYQGLWDASANTPTLPATPAQKGDYYIASVAGTQFGLEFDVGDWLVSDGAAWGKVDNTDAVASVNGKKGVVTITKADVGLASVDNTSDLNKPVSTAQQTALNLKANTNDPRFTDAREWTATEVSQAEAEAGAATTARKWTALRVRQAVVAWWNSISSTWGRDFVARADAAAGRSALGLDSLVVPGFLAKPSVFQSITSGVFHNVTFDDVSYNNFNNYSSATSRFAPTRAGIYLIAAAVSVQVAGLQTGKRIIGGINKNGVVIGSVAVGCNDQSTTTASLTALVRMNGIDDYVNVSVRQDTGAIQNHSGGASFFSAQYVGGL